MKTNRDNQEYAELLAKYLSGEMSEMEFQDFEEKNFDTEENKKGILEMKQHWTAIEGYRETHSPDTQKAWNKLHDRLREEKLIPVQRVVPESSFGYNLARIAAVALILVGIGTVVFLNMISKPSIEIVQLNTGNETNTLVKTLVDGSVIYIAHNSLLSFPEEFESGSRNVELKGEAFFDVAPNPDKPFIIETDEALITVLGTAFNVKTQNGKGFELCVDRGKVKVTLKKEPSNSEMVVGGEKISNINNSLVKSRLTANESISWYKQRMHFKDEKLQNIITVLNRNFNTTFVLANQEIGKHKLTVTFHNETAETMTELICMALNLKSQKINGAVVLSENE
jgi:ferric-dicitrate binding protein FerR (iron transport regulator)